MSLFLQFLLLGGFWGGSFIAIKYALLSVPFATAVLVRVLVGLLFLLGVGLLRGKSLALPAKVLPWVWLNGLLSIGVPFLFLFWAEERVAAGLAGIMNGTVPIWTALLGFCVLRQFEQVSARKVAGVLTGLGGITLIFLPSLSFSTSTETLSGLLALLAMALLYAAGTLLAKHLISGRAQVPVFAAAVQQHLASVVVVGITALVVGAPFTPSAWGASSVLALLYLGIFSTGLAFMIFFGLVSAWGPVRASTVTYLVPTVALALDFLVFGTSPKTNELLGIAIVFSGIFMVQRSAQ